MNIPIKKPQSFSDVLAYVVVICILGAFVLHFAAYGKEPKKNPAAELQRQIAENSTKWTELAKVAAEGRLATEYMAVLNRENNILRQQLQDFSRAE